VLASPDNGIPVLRTDDARRRRLVVPILVALVVGALVVALTAAGRQDRLAGSGSTLGQPLIDRSIEAYRSAASADNPDRPGATGNDWVLDGSGLEYEPVGSMGGIMRLAEDDVAFAVSDYPLSKAALDERQVVQFPLAVGALAVAHNLDLPPGATLRLDQATLAGIYTGAITRWDDPAITALNPGTRLPSTTITAVHRSDGSGSTAALTRYLSGAPGWTAGQGALVSWKGGVAAERSSGLVQAVRQRPGSIGYVERTQAQQSGLRLAQLENAAGAFVGPTDAAMRVSVAGLDYAGRDDYVGLAPTSAERAAYPLTVPIYALVERRPVRETEARQALDFLRFVLEDSADLHERAGYLPLPGAAVGQVETYWRGHLPYAPR